MLAVINRSSLSAVGVDTAQRFGADAATLSMFAVVQLAVYGGMQIPIGLFLDRYGARPIMTIGMLLMAAGSSLAFSPSVGVAIFARMLLGAGDAAIFPGVLRLVAVWFPAQRGPLMSQLTGLVGQAGQLLALAPLAALLHATSWEIVFGGIAGLCVLFGILVWAVIRNHPPGCERTSPSTRTPARSGSCVRRWTPASASAPPGRTRHPPRVLVALHGAVRRHRVRAALGTPFLTAGEGLSLAQAAGVLSTYVVVGMASDRSWATSPAHSPCARGRSCFRRGHPVRRVDGGRVAWAALWLLYGLAVSLAMGGPASMIAFDHARTHNPAHRLSTATGITNVGGFLAALVAIFAIGIALDLQGAARRTPIRLDAFRFAFLTQVPLWALGWTFIVIERRKTRVLLGMDPPRAARR
jgi:MFS family permease